MAVKRHMHKGRCITALLLLCCVIVFAVCLISRQNKRKAIENPPGSSDSSVTETQSTTLETTGTMVDAKNYTCSVEHLYIRIGHDKAIPIHILNKSISEQDMTWETSDANVAVVSTNGTVTPVQRGTCTIYICHGEERLAVPVTVREMTTKDGCTYVDDILIANKSYSLPESYDPGLLEVTEQAFKKMQEDAKAKGYDLYAGSDYRSYDDQVQSYESMVDGYGQEYADEYSARPGHSEHQTGYVVDCNTIDDAFGETELGKWVAEHCAEYGFIIRYPEDKVDITGYAYESWHLRYIGVEAAKEVMEQGLCLEEYLDVESVYED